MTLVQLLQSIVIGCVPLGVAYVTGLFNKKGKEIDSTATPYSSLVERVTYIERQNMAFQLWISLVIPIHADITARWDWYRNQTTPPNFPPFKSDN